MSGLKILCFQIRFQDLPVLVSGSSPPCHSCSVTLTTYATTPVEMTSRIGSAPMHRYR